MAVRTVIVVAICLWLAILGLGLAGSLPIAADASGGPSESGVEIDSAVADATGETTVVVRVADGTGRDRPATTAETETEAADRIASMQSRAATTQTAFERFAAGNPHVEIERQFWITNAVVVTVDTDRIPLERLGMVDNVTTIHDDFAVEIADGATPAGHGAVRERGSAEPAVSSPNPNPSSSPSPNPSAPLSPSIDDPTTPSIAASGATYTAGLEQMGVPAAWETFGNRGAGVRVAVLDTGVDADHPDIDVAGWKDFDETPSATPKDYGTHGTHVSGTVVGGNASGTHIGVAPEAELFHGAVLTDCRNGRCGGSFSQVVGGIEWAVENDADVVSMSLGASGYEERFIDPIRSAEAAGTLVVSSSGNAGEDTSGSPGNVYETVSVGSSSTGADESVSRFSSGEEIDTATAWGSDAPADWPSTYVVPDVVAPGESVYSAVPNGGYESNSGTSMAAPHVAGATALLLSNADDDPSPTTVRDRLAASAVDLDEAAHRQGDGRVDTFDLLLNHSRATMEPTITPTAINVSKPSTIAVDADHPVEEYRWEFEDGTTATTTEPSVDHTFAELGPTTVTLTLVDATDSTTVSTEVEVVDEIHPTVAFDAPAEPIVDTNVTVNASESTDNHGITEYEWAFGTNATETTTTTDPVTTHEFTASGERNVTLTATDPSGNTNATTTTVAVRDPPSVTIEQPAADATVAEHTVALEYTLANTDLANASGLEYRIMDTAAEPNDEPVVDWTALPFEVTADPWTKTVQTDGLPDGTYTISARLVDDEGSVPPFDTATTNRTVTVETPPPALSFDVQSTHADYPTIGQQNPANVTVSVTDPRHESTTIRIRNDTGALVTDWDVTDETGGGESVALEWPATDDADEPVESGSYEITARAADDLGDTNVSSTTVAVDTDSPSVAIDDVTGTAAAGGDVFVNESGEAVVAVTADDGRAEPGAVDHVSVSLESTATNYRRTVAAERDPNDDTRWTATVAGESLPDEGRYEVRATATDAAANANATLADASVTYDRTSPQLSTVVSDVDEANGTTTATVRVRSSEPLRDAPTVGVARPDGTEAAVEPLTEASPTEWTGSLEIDTTGRYNLTAAGADFAANPATETATATVRSTTTENRTATIAAEQSGAFVHLETTADVEGALAAVSETRTPPRHLEPNTTEIGFLTVALEEDLEAVRSNATVGIPAAQDPLPEGVTVDDDRLTAQWYDEGTARWERRNPTLREFEATDTDTGNDTETDDTTVIDTDTGTDDTTDTETAAAIEDDPRIEGEYWVAAVPDPATAGVTLVDDSPPELVASTPATDATLANDTGTVSVELEYADDFSGVDVSSLDLTIDGERVTDDAQVQLTSRTAVYEDLAVDAGETYEIALEIADRGGNDGRLETRFEVESDGDGDGDDGGGSSGGGGLSFAPVDDSGPDRPEPTAAIAIDPEPAAVGEEIAFSGAPSTDDERNIIRYEWVIDGTDDRGETVTTAFDEAGTYDIELTVTNDFAGNDTTATTVTVVDEPDEGTAGADENATDDPTDVAGGDEPVPEDRGDDTVPGFGVLVSLSALLAVAARTLRRGR